MLAGRQITVAQKPFVEADIKAAQRILNKLADRNRHYEVSSASRVRKVIMND